MDRKGIYGGTRDSAGLRGATFALDSPPPAANTAFDQVFA